MYSFSVEINDTFDAVIVRVTAALKEEGFGVLTDIDIAATLKAKMNLDKKPYRILGACNPPLANQALEAEADIGLLLPCNVVVRENDQGSVTVAFMDPLAVMKISDNSEVAEVAHEANNRLQRVKAALVS